MYLLVVLHRMVQLRLPILLHRLQHKPALKLNDNFVIAIRKPWLSHCLNALVTFWEPIFKINLVFLWLNEDGHYSCHCGEPIFTAIGPGRRKTSLYKQHFLLLPHGVLWTTDAWQGDARCEMEISLHAYQLSPLIAETLQGCWKFWFLAMKSHFIIVNKIMVEGAHFTQQEHQFHFGK